MPVLEDYKEWFQLSATQKKKKTFPFALQELFLYPVASAEKVSQKRRKKYIKKFLKNLKISLTFLTEVSRYI